LNRFLRNNGLTLVLASLFGMSLFGQAFTGFAAENAERVQHGESLTTLLPYLASGAFLSSLFENWESEFLQMWAFVMLTAYLMQKGSPESKDLDEKAKQDRDPALDADKPDAPLPVRMGGWARSLYSHSLGLALLTLFLLSFALHWLNSARHATEEAETHGEPANSLFAHLGEAEFWFESFQNWQSEFLSTAVLIVLAIFLREKGSAESKPVAAPHSETGAP
jgi:nicotinamide riboside transporter PnuC